MFKFKIKRNTFIIGTLVVILIGLLIFNFAPVTSTPVTSTPVTSTPVTSTPVTSAPVTSTPVTSTPVTSAPVTTLPVYSDWSVWSPCTLPKGSSCGKGVRSRTRRCISGNCYELSQSLECNVECSNSSLSSYINTNRWEFFRPLTNEIVELTFKVNTNRTVVLKDEDMPLLEGTEDLVWVEENNELKLKSPDNREMIVIRKKNDLLELELIPISLKVPIYKKGTLIDNWYCNEQSYPVRYRNGQLECIGTEGQPCISQEPDICPTFVNKLNTDPQFNRDAFDPNMFAQKVRLYSELTPHYA